MSISGCTIEPLSGGCFTAITNPDGRIIGGPLKAGEGEVITSGPSSIPKTMVRRHPITRRNHNNGATSLSIDDGLARACVRTARRHEVRTNPST